jgi:hypothetical protein
MILCWGEREVLSQGISLCRNCSGCNNDSMSRATPTMEMGELARGSVPQFVDGGLQSS